MSAQHAMIPILYCSQLVPSVLGSCKIQREFLVHKIMVKTWDGRAPFYPEIGYDKDMEFIERHRDHLAHEGVWLDHKDSSGEESSDDEGEDESSKDGGEDNITNGLTQRMFELPTSYDCNDHYQPHAQR
jgi:hypothetical protein